VLQRDRRKRTHRVEPAGQLVRRVLAGYGLTGVVREQALVTRWSEIVGDRVAGRTWPDGLRDGVLWVRVASSAWMHELSFMRASIARQANALVGAPPIVRDVRLHLGARRAADEQDDVIATLAAELAPRWIRRPRAAPPPLTDAHRRQIDTEVATVGDDGIRDALRSLRLKLGM
jgi:hypothetical protein